MVDGEDIIDETALLDTVKSTPYRLEIVWRNVLVMVAIHLAAIFGFFYGAIYGMMKSYLWAYVVGILSAFGVLVGSHRLWTHRTFKAHWTVRVVLMLLQTMALQNDIFEWARDHRVHHKFSETDADPHNSKRGFFFAHVGWLLCRKHPDVKLKGKQIDLSDLLADPVVRFQRQFYIPLVILCWGVFPVIVPYYFWDESLVVLLFGNIFRYVLTLHQTWLVNSAAHIYGTHPYNLKLKPTENFLVSYLTLGEGFHNYHHTFPWDYSASEHGWNVNYNPATGIIDLLAYFNLASDLRKVSKDVVMKRVERTGDTSLLQPYEQLREHKSNVLRHYAIGVLYLLWPFGALFLFHLGCFLSRKL